MTPVRPGLGALLVALQFALMGVLGVAAAAALMAGRVAWGPAAPALAAVLLGLWALSANRPGNFNIRPLPRAGGRLVVHGPYRWIRHPMYTSVIAAGAACAWFAGAAWPWLAWGALLVVLGVKAALEERWMLDTHPGYADYRRRTRRFLPGLY